MKVAKLNGKLLTNIKSKTILGGNTQEKTVTPSTERQVITADSGYTCLDKVNVEAVTSAIDSNIKPENIKKDVEILGVTGTMESASVPTKSWLYIMEYTRDGYFKAKTIGCSGNMPYDYMYGTDDTFVQNVVTRFLQELEINEGVTSVGYCAFQYCENLKSITIPDSVTSIGDYAFRYCKSLISINIPNGVKEIPQYAFYTCSNLTSITIPDSVTYIGSFAFNSCSKLVSINIPYGVTSISERCFQYCSSLTSIILPDSVTRTSLECFYSCRSLQNIKLSNNLTKIYGSTFYNCSSLTNIVMPSALTEIGSSAFNSCSKLELFDFRNLTQVPTLSNTSAFSGTPSTKKIVVPDSLYDTWITSTNWSSSSNGIVSSIIKASDYEASL